MQNLNIMLVFPYVAEGPLGAATSAPSIPMHLYSGQCSETETMTGK